MPMDKRNAIDFRKLQRKFGWEPSLQFEEGIDKTVKRCVLRKRIGFENVTSGLSEVL